MSFTPACVSVNGQLLSHLNESSRSNYTTQGIEKSLCEGQMRSHLDWSARPPITSLVHSQQVSDVIECDEMSSSQPVAEVLPSTVPVSTTTKPQHPGSVFYGNEDTQNQREQRQKDPEQCSPFMWNLRQLEFVRLVDNGTRLPMPDQSILVPPLTHVQLLTLLRNGQRSLPLLGVAHTQRLLKAAVDDDPMCTNGEHCMGKVGAINGAPPHLGGFTLLAFMTEEEHTRWTTIREKPRRLLKCVLCQREAEEAFVNTCRSRPHTQCRISDDVLLQQYRVLVDQPDGYKRKHMVAFDSTKWEGFVTYIVSFRTDLLTWRQDANTMLWFIDQSDLIYTDVKLPCRMTGHLYGPDGNTTQSSQTLLREPNFQ
jgi:hypothetical protein